MKKIKLLTGLASLSSLGMAVMPLTSCSKKKETTISKIEITTKPTKTKYSAGQKLDLTGMVVTASYSDGSTKAVAANEYTTDPSTDTALTETITKVTVKHTASNKTAEFNITVEPGITSLTITPPAKVSYYEDDKLDLNGFKVMGNWSDGRAPTDVTSECSTNPSVDTPLTLNDTEVTVTHTPSGQTGKFNITVNKDDVLSIEVTEPAKLTYYAGEKLDLAGMIVNANLKSGKQKDVTSQCTTNPDTQTPLTQGETVVTVTHTPSSKTDQFNVTVNAAKIVSLTVTPPTKTSYNANDKLDLSGLAVKANWTDGRDPTDVKAECSTSIVDGTALFPNDKEITVTHTPTGVTAKFDLTVTAYNFLKCTWTPVATACRDLEEGNITESQFCSIFKNGETEITSMADFVGLERKTIINNKSHVVRVIDTQHDLLETQPQAGKTDVKAALTFELVTLLSNSSGNKMTTTWDQSNNFDYPNSVLRANLTRQGTSYVSWKSPETETRSAFEMLQAELQTAIKSVKKEVATSPDTNATYDVTTYYDTLFPLTYTEMAQSGSGDAKKEGTAYKYWTNHNSDEYRIKKDFNGAAGFYWLVSPSIDNDDNIWYVDDDGSISNDIGESAYYPVSFGFCI